MRKVIGALAVAASLAACGSTPGAPTAAAPNATSAAETSTSAPVSSTTTPTSTTSSVPISTTTSTSTTSPTTTTSTSETATFMEPEEISGSGDDIVDLTSTGVRILKFECPNCDRNVAVKTNGRDSLLVNQIGSYSGRHLIDVLEGSKTTELEITADSDWTVTLTDPVITATFVTEHKAEGVGDDVLYFTEDGTKAKATHTGDGNFVVHGYGGSRAELAVNEIGEYAGTVRLTTPGLVQINADPGTNWIIETS